MGVLERPPPERRQRGAPLCLPKECWQQGIATIDLLVYCHAYRDCGSHCRPVKREHAMESAQAAPEDSAQEAGWRPDKVEGGWQHSKPPPEAQALTPDGQLHKLTLREGSGDVPPKHARCLGEAARRSIAAGARSPEGRPAAAPARRRS